MPNTAKSKLDASLVRELAAILREADLGEVEIEHDGLRIRVSKATSMAPPPAAAYVQAPAAVTAPAQAPAA
ncbi:MAG: acetyl-CoA carboxylase, biotin carboxyl carrier protein, partial [Henriciella sp.]|nr:acetyl-CoA carboxylase, biotin carboxyl carrier protein [Henriciella sp.]